MSLEPGEVRRLAALARLELGDEELEEITRQLDGILAHVGDLDPGDGVPRDSDGATGGTEAAMDRAEAAPLRADHPAADPLMEEPSALAPDWLDGFFTVPRLASHDEDGPGEPQ